MVLSCWKYQTFISVSESDSQTKMDLGPRFFYHVKHILEYSFTSIYFSCSEASVLELPAKWLITWLPCSSSGLWLVNYWEYWPLIGQWLWILASDWSDFPGQRLSWGCWLEQTPDKLNVSIKPRFASVFLPKMINCLETLAVKHNPAPHKTLFLQRIKIKLGNLYTFCVCLYRYGLGVCICKF